MLYDGGDVLQRSYSFDFLIPNSGYTGTFATINYPTASSEWTIEYNPMGLTVEYLGVVLPVNLIDFKAIANNSTEKLVLPSSLPDLNPVAEKSV